MFRADPKVDRQATVSVGDAIYSVPHELIGERVWVRAEGEQLVAVHIDPDQGPREIARHQLTAPGRPSIQDAHYPPRPAGALERKPRARKSEEREFLAIGEGAERWLKQAAAEGTQRIRRKMAEAVDLAKLHGTGPRTTRLSPARGRSSSSAPVLGAAVRHLADPRGCCACPGCGAPHARPMPCKPPPTCRSGHLGGVRHHSSARPRREPAQVACGPVLAARLLLASRFTGVH